MILELTTSELQTLQLALSITKLDLKLTQDITVTPTIDGIAAKVNAALVDVEKDLQFEKQFNS
jgi:hypothetical protein